MDDEVDVWRDEWMGGWMKGWMKRWLDKQTDRRIGEWLDGWMSNGYMDFWLDGCRVDGTTGCIVAEYVALGARPPRFGY